MLDKPDACKPCKWYGDGKGFVPDEIHPGAKITFCAQNPGENEEEKGSPLIGRSGRIVSGSLEKYGLKRSDANWMNILKCRWQHENELPHDEGQQQAITHCTATFLTPALQQIKSNVYVPIGDLALEWLSGHTGIESWRGSVICPSFGPLDGKKLLPTIHPSYLFKRPTLRTASRHDFARIVRESKDPKPVHIYRDNFRKLVSFQEMIETLYNLSFKKAMIAIDLETDRKKPVEAKLKVVGIAWSPTDAMNVYWHDSDPDGPQLLKAIGDYQGDMWSATPFDVSVLTNYGCKLNWEKQHDLTLLHSRFDIELPHTVEFICSMWTERPYWKWLSDIDLALYNLHDCVGEWEAASRLSRFCIAKDPLVWKVYMRDRLMNRVLVRLHLNGMPFSPEAYVEEKAYYEANKESLEAAVKDALGAPKIEDAALQLRIVDSGARFGEDTHYLGDLHAPLHCGDGALRDLSHGRQSLPTVSRLYQFTAGQLARKLS